MYCTTVKGRWSLGYAWAGITVHQSYFVVDYATFKSYRRYRDKLEIFAVSNWAQKGLKTNQIQTPNIRQRPNSNGNGVIFSSDLHKCPTVHLRMTQTQHLSATRYSLLSSPKRGAVLVKGSLSCRDRHIFSPFTFSTRINEPKNRMLCWKVHLLFCRLSYKRGHFDLILWFGPLLSARPQPAFTFDSVQGQTVEDRNTVHKQHSEVEKADVNQAQFSRILFVFPDERQRSFNSQLLRVCSRDVI